MSESKVIRQAGELFLNRLKERDEVSITCIGTFCSSVVQEYIKEEANGSRWLIPPSVTLAYRPSEYLLKSEHYTRLDFTPPEEYLSKAVLSPIADLSGENEVTVRETLEGELSKLLKDLFRGRRVTLFNLGDLFISEEVPGVLLLNFVPAPELLASLNTPFSAFAPTELHPEVCFPELELTTEPPKEPITQIAIPEVKAPKVEPEEESPLPEAEVQLIPEPTAPPAEEEVTPSIKQPKQRRSYLWLIIVLLIVAAIVAYYLLAPRDVPTAPEQAPPVEPDTTELVLPEVLPVTPPEPLDTVEIVTGTSLASFARKYYGRPNFWVYIFFANEGYISNPNNVPIGTKLVIPSLELFGITPEAPEALHEAKQWEEIILSGGYTSYEEQKQQLEPFTP